MNYDQPVEINIPQFDPLERKVNYTSLAGITAFNIGVFVAAHEYQGKAWWYHKKRDFHIQWGSSGSLQSDRMGHFFASSILSHYFASCLEASNVDDEKAALYGTLLTIAYEFYVEIEDGYAISYGFDPGDVFANFAGATYSLSQYYIPFLRNIQPRFSYYPSKEYLNKTTDENFLDDYEGQKHWISFKIKNILPKQLSEYWPEFLMLSVGTGIKNFYTHKNKHRDYYIALDLDYSVLPLHGKFWEFLKNSLNYIHFPMPGIRISPGFAAFALVY